MRVQSLHIYPIKGTSAREVAQASLEKRGLAHDRRWMLIDLAGRFISQRESERLALIRAEPAPQGHPGGLVVNAPGMSEIAIARPEADSGTVLATIWRDTIPARPAAASANAWFGAFLGRDCTLVWQGDATRPTASNWSQPGDEASFADGYPILVTTTGSLADLNARAGTDLPMNRFRPNIVVACDEPWAEDGWKRLRIGGCEIEIVKPCTRCVVTTVEQSEGRKDGQEPLRTLARFRFLQTDGISGAVFGQNAIPRKFGAIRIGDSVEIMDTQPAPLFKPPRAEAKI